jgi:hypothetical protein
VSLKLGGAYYEVRMKRGNVTSQEMLFDGAPVAGDAVPILRDGSVHVLELTLPKAG